MRDTRSAFPIRQAGRFRRALDLRPRRFLRFFVIAGGSAAAMGLLAGDSGLREVAPFFAMLLLVQMYPLLRRGDVDLFEPPILTGTLAAFATLATMAAFALTGSLSPRFLEYLNQEETVALVVRVVLSSIAGLIAYYIGYYNSSWGIRLSRAFPDLARGEWERVRLHAIAGLLIVAFGAAYFVFQGRLGVALTDGTELAAGKAVWREDPTATWMTRGGQLGFLAALLYLAHAARRKGWRPLLIPVALLLVNAWLVARMGLRGTYLLPLQASLGVLHYLRRRIPVAAFAGLLLAATILANLQYELRASPTVPVDMEHRVSGDLADPLAALAAHEGDRQRFAVLALIFNEFPNRRDHLLGESYAGLVATFVPRWLWPEKGNYFRWRDTMMVQRIVGAPIPSSYVAVLYANWSYPGILMGMLLWGVFQRAMYETRRRNPKDPGVVLVYCCSLVFFGSPTLLGVSAAVQFALPAIVAVLLIAPRRRKRGPSGTGVPAADGAGVVR